MDLIFPPITCEINIDKLVKTPEPLESSLVGDSSEDSSQGELWCLQALHGATKQNPSLQGISETPITWEEHLSPNSLSSENLKGMTKKVGTFGLQSFRRTAVVMLRSEQGTPGVPRPLLGSLIAADLSHLEVASHRLCKSLGHLKPRRRQRKSGPSTPRPESSQSKKPAQGPSKHQKPSRDTPEGGQAKRLKQAGQPSYARAAQEGIPMAIVCDGYPEIQVSRENFINIHRSIGGLVVGLPEKGFTPKLLDA